MMCAVPKAVPLGSHCNLGDVGIFFNHGLIGQLFFVLFKLPLILSTVQRFPTSIGCTLQLVAVMCSVHRNTMAPMLVVVTGAIEDTSEHSYLTVLT